MPWPTLDPFLFCVHHDDAYPAGNDRLGPAASLAGRALGHDFELRDGWRMYHGEVVPGFPGHPHRGFETVTIARRGLIDHSDSLGATARFGQGDVQWLTAGRGIVHAEMFPLVDPAGPNRVELFQIWLNLPRADKLAAPHFSMLWASAIPTHRARDAAGRGTTVRVIAGAIGGSRAPAPPPSSWAARAASGVAIWTLAQDPGAGWSLPPGPAGAGRALYLFAGTARVAGEPLTAGVGAQLASEAEVALEAGPDGAEALLLQGQPIGEPVAQRGPFVMSTPSELRQAVIDYERTRFGGWPWPTPEPVHPREARRFARDPSGRVEEAPEAGAAE
jgi:redox-sensitive bicupin YhaK (pirin superfamily)